jgi:D-sedoheptulose 7-phosphate isomerase
MDIDWGGGRGARVTSATTSATDHVTRALQARTEANQHFFRAEAQRTARLCHGMAERFARGGRLVALGSTPQASSDVRHVAVEFVHPVIVGKRALPAIGLAGEGGALVLQLQLLARPDDIVIAYGADERDANLLRTMDWAANHGCLTVSYARGSGAEWEFEPSSEDPFVRQELVETHYHVLWELVHVFFEHRGLLKGREARPVHDTGASSFLYPFLAECEHDLEAVVADVRRSIEMKSQEVGALRQQTLTENREVLEQAAHDLRRRFDAGGKLLALGNGGSATDAMDVVADFRTPAAWTAGPAPVTPRPAIDLTEDPAILTAIANDIGTDEIFQRQVIAYGDEGDILLALSTSGNSSNVIAALAEARRRELRTIAMVGYDGGRVASEGLADHVVITRSQHIPRIQEAQASAYHVLRELVDR